MKISKIQTYQLMKLKQNSKEQKQYNTSPAFKSIQVRKTSHLLSSLSDLFWGAAKLLALPALFIGSMVSILPSKADRDSQVYLKSNIYSQATNAESEEGTNVNVQEIEYFNDAMAFYEQTKNEKLSLFDGIKGKYKILADWTSFYTNLKSEEGMKLTANEKEQIKFAIDNDVILANPWEDNPKSYNKRKRNNIMQQELQRQFMHNSLFNNK